MPRRSALLLLGFATMLLPAAAPVPDQLALDLRWRFIGPFRGGRVLAVTGVPGEPSHFYFGSVNGGVWETNDAGRSWQPIFDDQPVGSIGAIAIAPSNPKIIYIGSGEADMRSDIAQGDGMFKSLDGGRTWRQIGLADSQQIGRVLVHPENPDLVFVAALGHPYGPNAERGVFRSTNGGNTWQKVLGPDANTGAIDVIFEPGNPRVIYAALWQTRRTPWNVYPPSNGPGSGVYKSTDGGDHWTRIGNGLPAAIGRVGLAIPPTQPARVYALVDAEPGGGVYRSDDAGAHWRLTSGDTRVWQRGWYFGRMTVDPRNADRIFALNTIVLRSDDGGTTFVPLRGDPTGDDFHDLWIDPTDSARQILGTDQGTIVTVNGGTTWSSWHNQPTAQFYHLVTDNRFPYFVYGAQQDSGAAGVTSRTTRIDGINLTNFREITAGGEADNIAPDPKDPDVIFGGRVDRLDLRTGQTRSVPPTLAYPDEYHRVTWTLPLVFSRRDPKVLYFAHQHLYRTEDRGEHWTKISPDLTRENPGAPPNLDPPTAALTEQMGPRRGVIYAIGPSPIADRHLWVGTDDGLIWRTRDEGAHWENVTPAALTPWSKIGIIEPSHHDAETAYAAVDRHRLDDFAPYVYRTRDGGRTWTLVANGIAPTHAVNVVREDPVRRGLLYAGTERGVYVSFDDGEHWSSLQINLPRTSVRDIEVKGIDLVIATHGRGFWILDDISALRQIETLGTPVTRVFAPAPAVRLRPEPFAGTPFPKEEPAAENPRFGAYIDYMLARPPRDPLTLVIRDAAGQEVRRYSSADALPKVDLAQIGSAPEWVEAPAGLATTPGLHRFVWPLRYAPLKDLGETNAFADGVWAPPGRYTIEMTVDGTAMKQPLEVLPDPRVPLPADAFAEQFRVARQIEAARARIAEPLRDAAELQRAVTHRRAGADGGTRALFESFQDRLTAVAGTVAVTNPSNGWWLPPKRQSLRAVATALDVLNVAVDGADAAPSADARAGLAKIESSIPAVLAAWHQLQRQDLTALNAKLAQAGQAPLVGSR